MLPPKEEGEAGHLYPENITPTPKSIQNLEDNNNNFSSSSSKDTLKLKCSQQEEMDKDLAAIKDSDFDPCSSGSSSSSSQSPGSPVEDEACCTSLIIIDSEFDNSITSTENKLESFIEKDSLNSNSEVKIIENPPEIKSSESSAVATIGSLLETLQELENVKTPEPSEMENSIVRASFVDFSADDEIDSRSQHSQGQPLEEESGEDEDAKEFSMSLNPDLPKIRAQQIQNWLEFEKEQEKYDSLNNNNNDENNRGERFGGGDHGNLYSQEDINNLLKRTNGTHEFELDSLSEQTGDHTLTDADGLERRVRFLTDPQGNILISVFLTKLVQFILSILKLATAGYLDFTSSTSNNSNNKITSSLDENCPPANKTNNPPTIPTVATDANDYSDPTIPPSHDLPCHYNDETDDITKKTHNSGEDGEEQHVIQVVQHAKNMEGVVPELGEPQQLMNFDSHPNEQQQSSGTMDTIAEGTADTTEEIALDSPQEEDESASAAELAEFEENENDFIKEEDLEQADDAENQQCEGAQVVQETKKVISVDPRLSSFDEGEDIGSDSETLSTSSCSSMIEVIPKEKSGEIEFIKNDDGLDDNNNNELKTDVIYLDDPDNNDKSITCYEFQPGNEANKEIIVASPVTESSSEKDSTLQQEKTLQESENNIAKVLSADDVKIGAVTSGEVATAIPEEKEQPQAAEPSPVNLLKFNPILEQEPKTAPKTSNVTQGMQCPSSQVDQMPIMDDNEQLVSLCIEEEPISAVALTIAKWESFSKKQQQQADSGERTNIAIKGMGKLILPSYTNNNNNAPPANNPIQNGNAKPISQQMAKNGAPHHGINSASIASAFNNNNHNNNKTSPGWNSWNNNNNNAVKSPNDKPISEDEEAIYAQPNSQAGSICTSISNPSAILKGYPKPNSRGEIINWFKEGEIHRSGILLSYGQTNHHSSVVIPQAVTSPVIVSWFFGLITRQQAEEFLHGQPTGTFLVRISTRIWGYTLSYQSNNKTKHFLISAINPAVPATLSAGAENNGQNPNPPAPTGKQQLFSTFSPGGRYAFIGTNMTPYTTLTSLIRHHSHAPITKMGGETLKIPCVGGPKIGGIEYVFK